MKKALLLSVVVSTMIMAGKNFTPVVAPIVELPVAIEDNGLYLGLAYGFTEETYTRSENSIVDTSRSFDEDFSSIMLQIGYKFNPYIAVEGRYWFGIDDVTLPAYPDAIDAPNTWGMYVKPIYPVTDTFDIYALLGYAGVDTSLNKVDDFSWGLGVSYAFTKSVLMFVDYVSLYNDDRDINDGVVNKEYEIDTINLGVTYNF